MELLLNIFFILLTSPFNIFIPSSDNGSNIKEDESINCFPFKYFDGPLKIAYYRIYDALFEDNELRKLSSPRIDFLSEN